MENTVIDAREQAIRKTDELMDILNRIKGTRDGVAVLQEFVDRLFEQGHSRTLRDAISGHFLEEAHSLYDQKHVHQKNRAISLFKLSSRVKAAW